MPAAAEAPLVRRRLRGKQRAPAFDPEVKRRPAGRQMRPCERCRGWGEQDCVFSTQEIGAAARIQGKGPSGLPCPLCSEANLTRCLSSLRGKGMLTSALAFYEERDINVFSQACARIAALASDEALDGCLQRLRRFQKKGATKEQRGRAAKEKQEAREADQWERLLARRKAQQHFTKQEQKRFLNHLQPGELKKLSKKFPGVYKPNGAAKRPQSNWQTALAASFKQWAEEHAWGMCQKCSRLVPNKFHPKHARRQGRGPALKHSIKACKHCARGVGYPVPQPSDAPKPLRKLSQTVLDALAIFDINTGPHEQEYNAYRAHTAPVRFSWRATSVEERLAELDREQDWEKGKAAFDWLRSAPESAYNDFLKAHETFLRRRTAQIASGEVDIDEPVRWLPLRFMETVGLECAMWPHLYWKTEMTETWARSQDIRRQARLRAGEQSQVDEETLQRGSRGRPADSDSSGESNEEQEDEAEDAEELKRGSAKASFVAKVFSPVAGYGACYELQHFVYDLWLSSSLGGARNAAGTTLRGALAGRVFSPMYWQTQHAGLIDLVRQIGLPHLFITIAPLEASAPYHAWLQDEFAKLLRTRTKLPAGETYHLAHVLMQAAEGLIGGTNKQSRKAPAKAWTSHVLSAPGGDSGRRQQVTLEIFARLEFQDGKRRRHTGPSQTYHGSGRTHLHMLAWLSDPTVVDWTRILRADLPNNDEEPELRSLVEGSQLDWQCSGWKRQQPGRTEPWVCATQQTPTKPTSGRGCLTC